eukprot:4997172-Ditylum_brightwellii.AAC.1
MEEVELKEKPEEENKYTEEEDKYQEEEEEMVVMDVNADYDDEEKDPIPVEGKSIQELVIKAGERDIGARKVLATTVRIEFKVKKKAESFNVRQALLDLLARLSNVDPNIYVQDKESGKYGLGAKTFQEATNSTRNST